MILSEIDLWLLREISNSVLDGKEVTTWDLAKRYDWDVDWGKMSSLKKKQFLDVRTTNINYRMKRMSAEGLVSIEKEDKKNHYVLDGNRIRCCKHTFPNGRKSAVLVMDKDDKWSAFEL